MNNKRIALAVGTVTAGVLVAGGWFGYQEWTKPLGGHVLRGYDATDPASTAPHTDNVFTGRVKAFEERREIDGWTQDVYQVEVASVLRGSLNGTVRVTYGLDEGTTARLKEGMTYVFATSAWDDVAKNGHAHLYQGAMKPVDDAEIEAWKKAAALPVISDR